MAINNDHHDLAPFLLDNGADPNAAWGGFTPLPVVVRKRVLVSCEIVRRWIPVVLYVGLIYLTIPWAPTFWNATRVRLGVSYGDLALYPLLAAGASVTSWAFYRSRTTWLTRVSLGSIAGIYYLLYRSVFEAPAEKLHLIEYGFLPWVIYRAMRSSTFSWHIRAVAATLLSFAFGAIDEVVQHFTAGRYGEVRDVLANWESSALGMAVLLVIAKPWLEFRIDTREAHEDGRVRRRMERRRASRDLGGIQIREVRHLVTKLRVIMGADHWLGAKLRYFE